MIAHHSHARTVPNRDIIVIGASAGGVEALAQLVSTLPADLPAAVFVTIHFPRTSRSVLPRILTRAGRLPAVAPSNGDAIERGRIYVAPPDWHLLIARGRIRLVRGPTENGNRPAVDPMFRSAAVAYGPQVIGVVLTGNLDDGTAGLLSIVRRGGIGIAQDPAEAIFPSMPQSAIDHGGVSHIVPINSMGPLLAQLASEEVAAAPESTMSDDRAARETAYSNFDLDVIEDPALHPGEPSPFSCPDCGGVLWQIEDPGTVRFRCRVGHGWTNDGLLMQQTETLETALWTALRALEESASLNRQMAQRATARGHTDLAERFEDTARLAERRASVVRGALLPEGEPDADPDADAARAADQHRQGDGDGGANVASIPAK